MHLSMSTVCAQCVGGACGDVDSVTGCCAQKRSLKWVSNHSTTACTAGTALAASRRGGEQAELAGEVRVGGRARREVQRVHLGGIRQYLQRPRRPAVGKANRSVVTSTDGKKRASMRKALHAAIESSADGGSWNAAASTTSADEPAIYRRFVALGLDSTQHTTNGHRTEAALWTHRSSHLIARHDSDDSHGSRQSFADGSRNRRHIEAVHVVPEVQPRGGAAPGRCDPHDGLVRQYRAARAQPPASHSSPISERGTVCSTE